MIKRNLLFVGLLILSFPVYSQEYSISGINSEGEKINENDVFFINDIGSFSIIMNGQENVSLKSSVWRLEGLNADSTYVPLFSESYNSEFNFILTENSIANYSNLKKVTFENDYSVCFAARITCVGKTDDDVEINLKFPVLLNFLPSIDLTILDYDITYQPYPHVKLKYKTEGADTFSAIALTYLIVGNNISFGYGVITPLPLQSDNYLLYIEDPADTFVYDELFLFSAWNSFGFVNTDTFSMRKIITSIKDFPDRTNVTVYPNPAHNYIHIQNSDVQDIKTLSIIDISGKTIKKVSEFKTDEIYIADIPQGIYILRIEYKDNYKNKTIKLIKN
jgi:hypothetical protein